MSATNKTRAAALWVPGQSPPPPDPGPKPEDRSLSDTLPVWAPPGSSPKKEYKPVSFSAAPSEPAGTLPSSSPSRPPPPLLSKINANTEWKPSLTADLNQNSRPAGRALSTRSEERTGQNGVEHGSPRDAHKLRKLSPETAVPDNAILVGKQETIDGDLRHTDTYYVIPAGETAPYGAVRAGQLPPDVTPEAAVPEPEEEGPSLGMRVVERKPLIYKDNIGPTTSQGIPTATRAAVHESKHHDWYKQMFKTLHKAGEAGAVARESRSRPRHSLYSAVHEEVVQQDTRRGRSKSLTRSTYEPSFRFPGARRRPDSPDSSVEGSAGDRGRAARDDAERERGPAERRVRSKGREGARARSQSLPRTRSTDGSVAKPNQDRYRVQPRSIEDYEPGRSSIALLETRQDELPIKELESLEQQYHLHNPPPSRPSYSYIEAEGAGPGRTLTPPPLSSEEQRSVYRQLQKGGDPPPAGFRRLEPERDERNFDDVRSRRSTSDLPASSRLHAASPPPADRAERERLEAEHRQRMRQIYEEERQKRLEREQRDNEKRKHHDTYTPLAAPGKNWTYIDDSIAKLSPSHKFGKERSNSQKDSLSSLPEVTQQRLQSTEPPRARQPERSERPSERVEKVERAEKLVEKAERAEKLVEKAERREEFPPLGRARALYNFSAQTNKELAFRKGDLLLVRKQVDRNWYEGEFAGRRGLFPINHVQLESDALSATSAPRSTSSFEAAVKAFDAQLPDGPGKGSQTDSGRGSQSSDSGMGRAKFTFHAQTSVELPLRKGESVTLLRDVDNNWFEGIDGSGRKGIVPKSYLEVVRSPTANSRSSDGSQPLSRPHSGRPSERPISQPANIKYNSLQRPTSAQYSGSQSSAAFSNVSQPNSFPAYSSASQLYPTNGYQPNTSSSYQPTTNRDYQPSASQRFGQTQPRHQPWRGVNGTSQQAPKRSQQPTLTNPAPPAPPPHHAPRRVPDGEKFRAVYPYQPQNDDELGLMEGDQVSVMEKCDDGWFVGVSLRTNKFGTFPGNYCVPL